MGLSVTDLGALQPREKCNLIFEIRLAILKRDFNREDDVSGGSMPIKRTTF